MPLVMKNSDMASYLAPSEYIDFTDPEVAGAAASLMQKMLDDSAESEPEYLDPEMQLAKICYEFVRDGIRHSIDIGSKKGRTQGVGGSGREGGSLLCEIPSAGGSSEGERHSGRSLLPVFTV